MHGDIGTAFKDRGLDGFREHPEAAHGGERGRLISVAVSLDDDEFDSPRRDHRPEPGSDVVRLPEGERATARAESQ